MVLPGNTLQKSKIWNDVAQHKLPHALLFSGPKGVGKYSFCKEIAIRLLGNETLRPPELVLVDMLYQEGVHSDMSELSHSSTFDQSHRKKLKKRSDSLGIDDVQSFTKHLHETVMGDWKIVIIRDLERMTIPASNTFLKILEEPPQKTLFLMTTSASSKILPTIFSRCRREYFSQVSENEERAFLNEHGGDIPSDQADEVLRMSRGRIALLSDMLSDREALSHGLEQFRLVHSLSSKTPLERMALAEQFAKKTISEIVEYLGLIETVFAGGVHQNTALLSFLEELDAVRQSILGNGNKKLFLERLFLSYPSLPSAL